MKFMFLFTPLLLVTKSPIGKTDRSIPPPPPTILQKNITDFAANVPKIISKLYSPYQNGCWLTTFVQAEARVMNLGLN